MRPLSESSAESSFLSYREATERAYRLVEEWNDEHTDRHDHYFEAVEEPYATMLPDTSYAQVAVHALPVTVHQYVIGRENDGKALLALPVTSFYSRGDVTSRALRIVDEIDIGRERKAKAQRDKVFAPQASTIDDHRSALHDIMTKIPSAIGRIGSGIRKSIQGIWNRKD